MASENTAGAFSSAQMKERDRRVEERHRKELGTLERKIENLRRSNDDTRKQLFDFMNRAERLSNSLGFENVLEAQEALDLLDEPRSFKETLSRVQELEGQLRESRTQLEDAEERLEEMAQIESDRQFLQAQNADLQEKFAELQDRHERAGALYKRDYAKWKHYFQWSTDHDEKHRMQRIAEALKTHERRQITSQLQQRIPDLARFSLDYEQAHEELITPKARPREPVSAPDTGTTLVPTPQVQQLKRDYALPSSSPTLFSKPNPEPISNSSDTEEDSQAPRLSQCSKGSDDGVFKLPALPTRIPNSSDTEDDTQPFIPRLQSQLNAKPQPGPERILVPDSSDTEDDPQAPPFTPIIHEKEPRPLASSNGSNVSSQRQRRPIELEVSSKSERPNKIRRMDTTGKEDSSTPRRQDENTKPEPRTEPIKGKSPLRGLAITQGSSSAASSSTKGRGRYVPRYSEPGSSKPIIINGMYTIDASKNGGRNYQYDEVVRDRNARRNLDAEDCECCRDYYLAVGPLPALPQAPLWASPTNTPHRKDCKHYRKEQDTPTRRRTSTSDIDAQVTRQREIDAHRKNISRHRHTWKRAKTPPDYWHIGFPSTQEVGKINEKAEEMHRKKEKEIERDAASGAGKYMRRT